MTTTQYVLDGKKAIVRVLRDVETDIELAYGEAIISDPGNNDGMLYATFDLTEQFGYVLEFRLVIEGEAAAQ